MYPAVCSECGTETQVPFLPTSGRPIYCRDCFQSRKGAMGETDRPSPRRSPPAPSPVASYSSGGGGRQQGAVKWFNDA
jgi:CxxC-x17-CxxC domain-containing protein